MEIIIAVPLALPPSRTPTVGVSVVFVIVAFVAPLALPSRDKGDLGRALCLVKAAIVGVSSFCHFFCHFRSLPPPRAQHLSGNFKVMMTRPSVRTPRIVTMMNSFVGSLSRALCLVFFFFLN